eukprot:snap_masked-scaffold_1-processed-gene-12.27-mRNA-1 protein AED:0.41 eAED:0.41 QI:0/-1/0/1/-1/1/1/0/392
MFESLYSKNGYFSKAPILKFNETINFNDLIGKSAYNNAVSNIYKNKKGSFATPVEIFKPHYSNSIARFILKEKLKYKLNKTRIIEIGGGNGTNAKCILDFLKGIDRVYDQIEYILVEVSENLSKIQQETLKEHKNKFKIINSDILNVKKEEFGDIFEGHNFVIGLEVLDNLLHDKIVYNSKEEKYYQVEIIEKQEEYKAIKDDLIKQTLQYYKIKFHQEQIKDSFSSIIKSFFLPDEHSLKKQRQNFEYTDSSKLHFFLPTGSYQLIQQVSSLFPSHTLFLADFDFLPVPKVKSSINNRSLGYLNGCINFPIIASPHSDHMNYFEEFQNADIFFQTDFKILENIYPFDSSVIKSKQFFSNYADLSKTKTKNGFNPILEDFSNTSIFIGRKYS